MSYRYAVCIHNGTRKQDAKLSTFDRTHLTHFGRFSVERWSVRFIVVRSSVHIVVVVLELFQLRQADHQNPLHHSHSNLSYCLVPVLHHFKCPMEALSLGRAPQSAWSAASTVAFLIRNKLQYDSKTLILFCFRTTWESLLVVSKSREVSQVLKQASNPEANKSTLSSIAITEISVIRPKR